MRPDWIAVDWGTSNVRAWAMGGDGAVLAEAGSDRGMGTLTRDQFEGALRDLVGRWMAHGPVPVLACGMVGARQGWVEAAYAPVPGPPLSPNLTAAPCATPGLSVRIVPGLCQADPPDVMRGEETKLAGLLAREPDFDGVVLMPGTHPKWVRLSAGEVVGFRTSLTGEALAALSGHTVLRHSVGGEGWDEDAFLAGVAEGMARPEALLARLFGIRAEGLLRGLDPAAARASLAGLLIGCDLAGARGWWLRARVALVSTGAVGASWRAALAAQGAPVEEHDATLCTLDGLREAHRRTA